MNAKELTTVEQVREFLAGTRAMAFEVPGGIEQRYRWVQQTLAKYLYPTLNRQDKETVVRFVIKVAGYSREQVFRLVRQYVETGRVERRRSRGRPFAQRYTAADRRLLAVMDERHNTPNGLAMKKLCERAHRVFGQAEFERLAGISVAHLYNLRRSLAYLRQRTTLEKTRPSPSVIGERRKPRPQTSLGEIIAPSNTSGSKAARDLAFRSINSKRLDFPVIDRSGMPALAIECQGYGHYQNRAFMRDAMKREAVRKAGFRS